MLTGKLTFVLWSFQLIPLSNLPNYLSCSFCLGSILPCRASMYEVIPMYMNSKISIAIPIELIGNALAVIGFGALVIKYIIINTNVPAIPI
jgi:hypothetical protein